MSNFIKESFAELRHVVWPTHLETKNFFKIVVAILVVMTLFTWVLTLIFSNMLFGIRGMLHTTSNADISASPTVQTMPITVDPIGENITVTPTVDENIA